MAKKLRPSCAVILTRKRGDDDEVFLVQRSAKQRFFPDFYAFPGGNADPEDSRFQGPPEIGSELYQQMVTASREIFEETGLLLTDGTIGSDETLPHLRQKLLQGEITWAQILDKTGTTISRQALLPLGIRTTPPFSPRRYQTRFFLAPIEGTDEPEIIPGELDHGRWMTPREAVDLWGRGEIKVAPPVYLLLELMAEVDNVLDGIDHIRTFDDGKYEGRAYLIPFEPHSRMIPVKTDTIPPATHTNCYLIGGEKFYIVDPGPDHSEEQQTLLEGIRLKMDRGHQPLAVILTHHHHDHIGAAAFLHRELDIEIWAHPLTAQLLAEKGDETPIHLTLDDGQVLEGLDIGPVQVIHTPGHARDHLSLYLPEEGLLYSGDMMAGASSILVPPPPAGSMSDYMKSLDRLSKLDHTWLFPGHGPPTIAGPKKIQSQIKHRKKREQSLLEGLEQGKTTRRELVNHIYADEVPASMLQYAEYSLMSTIHKLLEEGVIEETAEGEYQKR